MPTTASFPPRWPRALCVWLGALAMTGGVLSLLGWALDRPGLTDWFQGGISIQPNAALAASTAGLGMVLMALGLKRTGALFGALCAAIGAATVVQWLSGFDFGIDQRLLFERAWGRTAVVRPGRMGIPASVSFALLGLALIHSASSSQQVRRRAPLIGLGTFGIALLSITGYMYGADVLFTVPSVTAIALQTAVLILMLSAGVIALHPERAPMRWLVSTSAVGIVARRAVPALVVAPVLLGWLRLTGERLGFYDTSFGTALLVLALIALLGLMLWRGLTLLAQHEANLVAAEQRVQLAITAGDAATWDLDLVTGASVRSDSYFRLLGYEPVASGHAPQDFWASVVWTEDLPIVQREWNRALTARDLFRAEYRVRRADETLMWARAAGRFFYDDSGRAVRFVGVFVDVTDEHRAIETLRDADRRKDEFIAMLAHELRNPLAPIRNALGVLKLRGTGSQEVLWARDVIDRQLQQMTRLIDDLLDTSRIGTGKIELQRERVELAAVLHGAIEASRPLLAQYGHELKLETPPDPVWLHGDLVRLSQVFCNLLNNAARYTPQGGQITVRASRVDGAVAIAVRDNGIGIPREMLPRVFDMFTQVDRSLERSRGGLGIGLTLVKQLVELHGGQVEAHSEGIGRGCEFVVRLPTVAAVEARPRTPQPVAAMVSKGRRVLVVDDNEDAAESLAMLLRLLEVDCRTAHDGLAGLEVAREYRPDVVLLDIGLPGLNGYDVATAIRGEGWAARTKIVALTGWGQEEDRQRSRAAGFDAHLVKPVALEQLSAVLQPARGAAVTA